MKLLRGTYGNDAVSQTTKGDQISVRLDGQTAVVNLDTLVSVQKGTFEGALSQGFCCVQAILSWFRSILCLNHGLY